MAWFQSLRRPELDEDAREETLTRMMSEYGDALVRLAYLCLGDASLAEDAVQEAFFKAYRHLDSFRGDSAEKTWLSSIVVNTCRDMRRSSFMRYFQRTVPIENAEWYGKEQTWRDDSVLQAVMALPETDKQVILLRYYQELPVSKVAKIVGTSESAVASRITRAKSKLREALKEWYFDEE